MAWVKKSYKVIVGHNNGAGGVVVPFNKPNV